MTPALLRMLADERVDPGLLGFIVVALLGVATWLLLRSMIKHLRRVDVPADREEAPAPTRPGLDDQA